MENGKWKMENGKWKMENGKWKMENGKWKMENGKWKMENAPLEAYLCAMPTFVYRSSLLRLPNSFIAHRGRRETCLHNQTPETQ
jgi:hypothetical protein